MSPSSPPIPLNRRSSLPQRDHVSGNNDTTSTRNITSPRRNTEIKSLARTTAISTSSNSLDGPTPTSSNAGLIGFGDGTETTPSERVQVVVRCRPLSGTERSNGNVEAVDCNPSQLQISVKTQSLQSMDIISGTDSTKKTFTYDGIFDSKSTQVCIVFL